MLLLLVRVTRCCQHCPGILVPLPSICKYFGITIILCFYAYKFSYLFFKIHENVCIVLLFVYSLEMYGWKTINVLMKIENVRHNHI